VANVPGAAIQCPHDGEIKTENPQPTIKQKTYFSPNRSYCVETACAPCGVVIAWTKFPKSESPTNIFNWLDELFLNKGDQPSYICMTKHVKFSKQLLEVRGGKIGQTQLVLLLIHIITTIIVPQM